MSSPGTWQWRITLRNGQGEIIAVWLPGFWLQCGQNSFYMEWTRTDSISFQINCICGGKKKDHVDTCDSRVNISDAAALLFGFVQWLELLLVQNIIFFLSLSFTSTRKVWRLKTTDGFLRFWKRKHYEDQTGHGKHHRIKTVLLDFHIFWPSDDYKKTNKPKTIYLTWLWNSHTSVEFTFASSSRNMMPLIPNKTSVFHHPLETQDETNRSELIENAIRLGGVISEATGNK